MGGVRGERTTADVVGWTVEPTPALVAARRRVRAVVEPLADLVVSGPWGGMPVGADVGRVPRVPSDPAVVVVRDLRVDAPDGKDARLLPPGEDGPLVLEVSQQAAWVPPRGTRQSRWPLPLERLRVERARPLTRSGSPRHAFAPWELVLSDGSSRLTVRGRWISLAWLGHVAGWPEPTR